MKQSFIVQTIGFYGHWGAAQTVKEAAKKCHKAGAKASAVTNVKFVMGDDSPEISADGLNILLEPNSQVVDIGTGIKLGQLIKLS